MGIFKEVKDTIGSAVGWFQIRKNPLMQAAAIASSITWEKLPLLHQLSEAAQNRFRNELLQKVNAIAASSNPVITARAELVVAARQFGAHHVLVIDPPPAKDGVGLIGLPGVSGRLRPRLIDVLQKSDQMREWAHGVFDTTPTNEDIYNALLGNWCLSYWHCATFNAMRQELKDCNPVKERDWYRPLLWSTCATWETAYRLNIGAFDTDGMEEIRLRTDGPCYDSFGELVLQGHRYPDLAWREAFADSLASGSLAAPDFANL